MHGYFFTSSPSSAASNPLYREEDQEQDPWEFFLQAIRNEFTVEIVRSERVVNGANVWFHHLRACIVCNGLDILLLTMGSSTG